MGLRCFSVAPFLLREIMPYTIDKPEELPENVQELSDEDKAQWIEVFNSAHVKCLQDGMETDECEAEAFKQANGTVKAKAVDGGDEPEPESETDSERTDTPEDGQPQPDPEPVVSKAPDFSGSAMVAFYPSPEVAQFMALSIPEAISILDLHMTLMYLGDAADISPEKQDLITRAIGMWAKTQIPIDVRINGLARFTKIQEDGTQALVALLDSPHLEGLCNSLCSEIRWQTDIKYEKRHGFMPHITLAYISPDAPFPIQNLPETSFTLRKVCLKIGNERYDVELTGEMQHEEGLSKAGRRNSTSDMKMIQDIHDKATDLGAECKGMNYSSNEQKAVDQDELDDIYGKYHTAVNMSASELETWSKSPCSKKASIDRSPIKRNLRLLGKNKEKWTEGDIADANRTISFVARMKANLGGKQVVKDDDGNECGTKAHISLKNWAYDSKKNRKAIEPNALKALSRTDDELVVGNYIALWGDANGSHLNGGRDLEGVLTPRKNADGSTGEFFTKSTNFESDFTITNTVIVDLEHGQQPDKVGPTDNPLGRVDWKSAKADDVGLFVKRFLNRRNQYIRMLDELGFFDKGLVGTSSQAVSAQVRKSPDGEIERWPLERDTLTATPMEPRMMTDNQLSALKALQAEMPQLAKAIGLNNLEDSSEGGGGPSREELEIAKARIRLKQRLAESAS